MGQELKPGCIPWTKACGMRNVCWDGPCVSEQLLTSGCSRALAPLGSTSRETLPFHYPTSEPFCKVFTRAAA